MIVNILSAVHLTTAIVIIVLVLLQQGKGAGMGAAFGGGNSQSVFGSRGSSNFLSRTTAFLVAVFFLTSLSLAYIYTQQSVQTSVMQDSGSVTEQTTTGNEATDEGQSVDSGVGETSETPVQGSDAGVTDETNQDELPEVPK